MFSGVLGSSSSGRSPGMIQADLIGRQIRRGVGGEASPPLWTGLRVRPGPCLQMLSLPDFCMEFDVRQHQEMVTKWPCTKSAELIVGAFHTMFRAGPGGYRPSMAEKPPKV